MGAAKNTYQWELLEKESLIFSNDISAPLETQDLEQVLNPGHNNPQAASPDDQGASHPRFLIQTSNKTENEDISINLPKMTPRREHNKFLNGGKEIPAIGLLSLRSTLVANQDPSPEENVVLRLTLNNISHEQKGCTTLPEDLANEHPSCTSAILSSQNLGVLPIQIIIS
ncbi:hypothetical protein DSO57_1028376 [Entomophthora muscae]|uniref:Uncharacterized protein n=1 Tax=Entomophthora muscae TaxID=34485 RepID=A0ACC2TNN7_9FUNG|nr:hypothetical protein DSO57_1028376 [Entomophthora muscae]